MNNSPAPKPSASVKKGDAFILGDHVLLCGDSMDIDSISRLLEKRTVNMILLDPPYGVNFVASKEQFRKKKSKHQSIENDHVQTHKEYREFSIKWLQAILPHLAKKNSIYIFNVDHMLFPLHDALVEIGCHFSQILTWIKSQAVIGRKDYLPQHEFICVAWYGTHVFYKAKDKSVLFCPKPARNDFHPTSKPILLLRRLILNSSAIGDTVFDGFGGGGSTLLACEQTRRRCVMVECNEHYCETIIQRFEQMTGIRAKPFSLS